jgi:hypothetical protein
LLLTGARYVWTRTRIRMLINPGFVFLVSSMPADVRLACLLLCCNSPALCVCLCVSFLRFQEFDVAALLKDEDAVLSGLKSEKVWELR